MIIDAYACVTRKLLLAFVAMVFSSVSVAEVTSMEIGRSFSLGQLPAVVMEKHHLVEKHAKSAGLNANVAYGYTFAMTAYTLNCALLPDLPNNDGMFRALTVRAPEGSLLNAKFPASVGGRVGDVLPLAQGAEAHRLTERAAHWGTIVLQA